METCVRAPLPRLVAFLALLSALPFAGEPRRAATSPLPDPQISLNICDTPREDTFEVFLPKLTNVPDEEGQGWVRPPVWGNTANVVDETISVPNGRPIYALIVSGYSQNRYLDELLVYNFARHLMARGAYVHYAWWNNLLAPYMARPLHHAQSYPGNLGQDFTAFTTAAQAAGKALPGEDYQFLADATLFLKAIRKHNPSAIIILVGHSMGGGAITHLADAAVRTGDNRDPRLHTDELIDMLAPIDPVNNRNYPWAGTRTAQKDYNWTRWRVTRHNFRGYRSQAGTGMPPPNACGPIGAWLKDVGEIQNSFPCELVGPYVDDVNPPSPVLFDTNVINMHYRYQTEALFPFDFESFYGFAHNRPPGSLPSGKASAIATTLGGVSEVGGWPSFGNRMNEGCCANFGAGVGWSDDGHGEIVGHRGPVTPPGPVPLGVRVRTSPQCGSLCAGLTWPSRVDDNGTWSNPNASQRVARLQALETLPQASAWGDAPVNPSLCLVSQGLINRFNAMNKPPVANAGPDQTINAQGPGGTVVTLNATASADPDNDTLTYTWNWLGVIVTGPVAMITFPPGRHCVGLTVRDPSGHMAYDTAAVIIQDTTPAGAER